MIPQKHVDEKQPVEQASSPVEKQSSRPNWLRITGVVVLSLVLGVLDMALGMVLAFALGESYGFVFWVPLIVLPLAVGGIGGILWRSWWALLLVPAAYAVGVFIGILVTGWGASGSEAMDLNLFLMTSLFAVSFPTFFALIGAAVSISIGKWWELRRVVQSRSETAS